jgi:hypothetical protein
MRAPVVIERLTRGTIPGMVCIDGVLPALLRVSSAAITPPFLRLPRDAHA